MWIHPIQRLGEGGKRAGSPRNTLSLGHTQRQDAALDNTQDQTREFSFSNEIFGVQGFVLALRSVGSGGPDSWR